MPTPNDAIIKQQDGILLQYAYSREFRPACTLTPVLLGKFLSGYGGRIPSKSLQHAIMACAAFFLKTPQFEEQIIEHIQKTSYALRKKTTQNVDDADLLAVLLLAQISPQAEQPIHRHGMVAILNALGSNSSHVSNPLALFRPFFIECLLPGGLRSLGQVQAYTQLYRISFPPPTTAQRLRSYEEMRTPSPERIPGSRLSLNAVPLYYLFHYQQADMFSAIAVVQEMEEKQMFQKDAFLDWMIAKWSCDIGSPESRTLLEIADRVLELNPDSAWGESFLLEWACIFNLSCHMLLKILTEKSLLEAFHSPGVVSQSHKLVSLIKLSQREIRDKTANEQFDLRKCLFLGGLAISRTSSPSSNTPNTLNC